MHIHPQRWLIIALALALLVSACGALMFVTVIAPVRYLEHVAAGYDEYQDRFSRIRGSLAGYEIRALRTNMNEMHIAKAQELGVSGLYDTEAVKENVKKGTLVFIPENRFWRFHELKNSIPFVTPATARLLETIGRRFQQNLKEYRLPPYRYTISSALRTRQDHQRLIRINRNATRGISSHEFGTAVDILYREFDYTAESPILFHHLTRLSHRQNSFRKADFDTLAERYADVLRTVLARTLIELQDEGRCYVILERNQPVFHVTLASNQ